MGLKNKFVFFLILGMSNSVCFAETTKTIFNPFTGLPDFITKLSSSTIPGGSTSYIQNTSTLQSGSTFYVSSGTVLNSLNLPYLTASQCVQTNSTGQLTSSGGACGGAGNPAGGNYNIQFSSASAFAGDSNGNVFRSSEVFSGSGGVGITYNLTVGSVTVNGSSAGAVQLTEGLSSSTFISSTGKDNFWADTSSHAISATFNGSASTYTVVTSSWTPVANQYLFWAASGPNGWVVGSTASAGSGGGGGGSNPGAPLNAVQYNNPLGTFAGSANFTYNGTTLTVANSTVQVNNADASSFNNYSSILYNGFNSFSFTGTTITLDSASPFTTGSSMTVNGVNGLLVKYGATLGSATVSNLSSGQCVQTGAGGLLTGTGSACSSGGGSGIVSPGTFTWVNNLGIQVSTFVAINSNTTPTLQVSTASTGVAQLAVSSIVAVNPTDFLLTVSSTSGTMVFGIQNNSHFISSGTAPTMGTCGSSPSVIGTDNAGTITVGGGVVTTCTLNFASAWGQVPVCIETDNSTTITGDISAISTTAITFSFSASLGGGQIYYICIGSKG